MNLDDLQNAINVLYNPQTYTEQVRQQAQQYCDSFVQQNAANLKDFFFLFVETQNQQTQFWLLQAICDIVGKYYYEFPIEKRAEIHQTYLQLLAQRPNLIFSSRPLTNKYALIFLQLLRHDFPANWQNAFQELFSLLSQTQDSALQQNFMGLYVKVLILFEDEFIEQKIPQQCEINARVKDAIRELAIKDIVFLFQQALSNYTVFPKELVNDILQATAFLIDWNALELFSPMIVMYKEFLTKKFFLKNALKCLFAFVHKGMDYPQKVEVISGLQFLDIIESFKIKYTERNAEDDFDKQQEEEELFEYIADIINKLGQWCFEVYGNIPKLLPDVAHQQEFERIFNRILQYSLYLLNTDKPKIGRPILEFLSYYLQTFKKADEVSEFNFAVFQEILKIITLRIKYPSWCTFTEDSDLTEFEEDYRVYREDLSTIYLNLSLIKPFHQPLIAFVHQLFQNVNPGVTPANEAEVPLFLSYHLYQSIPNYMKERIENNQYYDLLLNIININFLVYDHKIVILMVLENIIRYSPYFINSQVPKEKFVDIFFSNKAIQSTDPQIASRSTYLFLRFCERNAQYFSDVAQPIIQTTMQIIQKIEGGQINAKLLGMDECNYLYNIMGLFVCNKQVDHEYRREVVTRVLEHLVAKLEGCQPHERDKIQNYLKFINVFTKGFQTQISQPMKEVFAKVLTILMQILKGNMNHNFMSEQILLYLQRNILILEVQVKPFIKDIAGVYIQTVPFERLESIINLMNVALSELKLEMMDVVDEVFQPLFKRMYETPIPSSDTSDIEKVQIRQFQVFFKFIMTAADINSLFLVSPTNLPLFKTLVDFLVANFQQNADKTCKKYISVLFKQLLIDYSGLYLKPDSLQAFSKKASPTDALFNKCLIGVLDDQFAYFNEKVLSIISKYPYLLDPKNLDDTQIIYNLIDTQSLYVIAGWQDQLVQWLKYNSMDDNSIQIIVGLCQSIPAQQATLKVFRENYMKILHQYRAARTATTNHI